MKKYDLITATSMGVRITPADRQPVGGILHVDPGKDLAVPAQQSGAHGKAGVGGVGMVPHGGGAGGKGGVIHYSFSFNRGKAQPCWYS